MDLEEEVIFEGSPLAEHMANCGMMVEVEKTKEKVDPQPEPLTKRVMRRLNWAHRFWKKKTLVELFRKVCVKDLMESELMEREELERLVEDTLLEKNWNQDPRVELLKRGVCDSFAALVPSVTLCMMPHQTKLLRLLICVPPAVLLWKWWPMLSAWKEHYKLLQLLKYSKEYKVHLKQAIKVINDSELMNRGYMILATAYSLDMEQQRRMNPLPNHLDHPTLCLPAFSMDESKNYVIIDEDGGSQLPTLRDLKSSIDILNLKQQEYLRRLLRSLLCGHFNEFLRIEVGKPLLVHIVDGIKELGLALIVYKALFTPRRSLKTASQNPREVAREVEYIHNLIYSSRAHLQEAIMYCNEIEECVVEDPSKILNVREIMDKKINQTVHHIDATMECLNRVATLTARYGSMGKSEIPTCETVSMPTSGMHGQGEDEVNDAVICDYQPQDEVFEAIVRGENDVQRFEDFEAMSESEESNRESSTLMLKELKIVLKVREDDWKEREKKVKGRLSGCPEQSDENRELGETDEKHSPCEAVEGADSSRLTGETAASVAEKYVPVSLNLSNTELGFVLPRNPTGMGDELNSDVGTWVSPVAGNASMPNMPAAVEEKLTCSGFNLGNLASEAVAKAKANRLSGLPLLDEESFEILGDE